MTADLRHLRAFLAIAAEGSVTGAAARLHVTQPALSRTLRQLEEHLGMRLVDRSTHHLRLTAAGEAYRQRAEAAVAAVDATLDPARAGTWPLRLGHAWSALGVRTTALLRRWAREHPDVPLELLRIDDDRHAGLLRGRSDVAILRDPPPETLTGLRAARLLSERRFAVVPTDSPLAGRAELTLADLAAEPVAMNRITGSTTRGLWPPGTGPARVVDVVNTDDWLIAIAAGRAVGVSTEATVAVYPNPDVAYVPLADAPPVSVVLAWPEPVTHPSVPALVDLAFEVLAE
ncbi:LysR family transcriptional regulator [Catenuloplanes atrovinosus]|uniref:DNA-binding transcriptional LysR family regulator n=1 Tax=Catenuloplanes atrovinosus TaxID=137266 RepID=A0AAE3YQE9_9ACTN|nr:LysR family transcriptional regulator [Catenuloplanes atrovinosus]MDR7278093.1 DNA-binding transcriptional LysR family regulator [Catenuloplanes atrovinosus]